MINLLQFLAMEIWFKEISRSNGFTTSKVSITTFSQLVNSVMRIWRLLFGNLRKQLHQLQSVSWLKHYQLKHGYGIEDVVIGLPKLKYVNLLSKKDVVIGLPKLKYVKDQLCSPCEVSKAKRSSFKSKTVPSSKGRLNLLHMDLFW
ncbi:hypothetical protein Tco_0187898 [Tanacetum coccineum]